MNNVIQLSKSQGFTRMDNDLYEALIGADLSGRELRVALAIHRLTIGFNTQTSRIAASVIAKLSGIHADNVSRIISELLRQRVIFRTGGSRSPIGISPVSEWKIDAQNDDKSNLTKSCETVVFDRSRLSKTTDYKDSKDITNSNELVTPAKSSVISKPKAKTAKPATGIKKLLADNPHGASEKILTEYLALRKAKRAPITDTVWASINTELGILASHGLSADESLAVAIKAAWQGFESEWVLNRMRRSAPLVRQSNEPDFDSVEWANDLGEW